MASHFDLLDLADGEFGAAAVSVLVAKKKAAEAAREARKAARKAEKVAAAEANAVSAIIQRRADAGEEEQGEVTFTESEMAEIEAAVQAAAEWQADEMDEEEEQRPTVCFYNINKKVFGTFQYTCFEISR
jgi:predicted  nucleic acid-binding Zn-ribbon protein